jgi:hypothetical protein
MKSVSKINISEIHFRIVEMAYATVIPATRSEAVSPFRKAGIQKPFLCISMILLMIFCSASIAQADYFNLAWGIQYDTNGVAIGDTFYEDVQINSLGDLYTMWCERDASATTTFIRKLSPMGNILWTKAETRGFMEMPCRLQVDSQNNFYIFGYSDGPSGGTYYGGRDGFVRKYNSDGQLLWARQQGSSGYDVTFNGTFDTQGNIYTIGHCLGLGAVVVKYDSNGNFQWQKYYQYYHRDDQGSDIIVSSIGDIYFGLTSGFPDPFDIQAALFKLNQNGDIIWTQEIGVPGVPDSMVRIAGFDTQGRIVFTLSTMGALGGTHLGSSDVAVGRCDSSGNIEWIGQYGSSGYDATISALIGPSDYITMGGETNGSFFGTNQGSYDAFIMQVAADGNLLGGSQFGTSGYERFYGLCSNGTVFYVSGPTEGSLWGPNAGGQNVIFGKLNLEPTNDEKADAIQIEINDVINGWTVGATGTDITLNGYNDSNDVWYYFEPNESGKYTIEVYDATFDTTLAVFDANDKEVIFNDDFWGEKSVVILKAKAGKRYYIRVAGYDEETGDFTLSIHAGAIQAIQGDLNYDGNVDMTDFAAFADNWLMGG